MTRHTVKKAAAIGALLAMVLGGGVLYWRYSLGPQEIEGFASGNGRIEATEIDIATKRAGRLEEVLVNEGDRVEPGQVLARVDRQSLLAELRQAEARVNQAYTERDHAKAVIKQRESECELAEKDLKRTEKLYRQDPGAVSREQLEHDTVAVETAQAACAAAEAQLANAEAAIQAALAEVERIKADLDDTVLRASRGGRVLYRLAEPGEVLPAGGKVLTVLDLTDVYMTIFLPTAQAGRVSLGAEARIVFDAAPEYVVPAAVSFVAPRAQFTPKEVETRSERDKLMFRIKLRIAPELLKKHIEKVKTGVPGVAYVRLDPQIEWPQRLEVRLPE
ncbi:HlyD family secretion protein [Thiogranum longum]